MASKIATDLVAGDRVVSPAGETMTVAAVEPIVIRKSVRVRVIMTSGDSAYLPLDVAVTLAA